MSPDVANEETAPTVEGFRRHSYQRPDPETASPPVQDNTSANQQQQRRRSSVRRRRNSQHRRSSFIMTRIRQALSIDYEPAGVNEEEEFSEEQEEDPLRLTEESLSTTHNSPRYGRYLIGLLGVLGVLVVAPLASKDRRHNANTKNPTVKDNNNNHPPINTIPPDTCDTNPNLITQRYQNKASKVGLPHGAVAADHALCSSLGTRILQAGGTAADAAVTTALCLGVANPASSGLGGGGFILVHGDAKGNPTVPDPPAFRDARTSNVTADSGKITEVIDCRETAPAAATTRMFVDNDNPWASTYGGLAAAVPGECVGLEVLHARHGALSWQTVVQPVVEVARSGVEINTNLAFEIALTAESYDPKDPGYGLRALLTHQDDWQRPLLQGELFKNEKLADTLQAIMDQGCRALYQGERAKGLAKDVQKAGGVMTAQDIASYVPTLRSPVVAHDIQGFSIAGVPPPSSGGAAIVAIARFLAGYASPFASFADTLSMHRFVEGCRHVFALRMSLSDPDYNTETVQQVVRDMVEGTYIDGLRNITRDDTTLPLSQYGGSKWAQLNDTDGTGDAQDAKEGDRRGRRKRSRRRRLWREFGYLEDHGTSHFSIVDGQGNAVAMTTSVNMYFGSQVVSESTGIIINNQMDDFGNPGRPDGFGLPPAESNFILPGKRPLSSMSPTMMFRRSDAKPEGSLGELVLALGASGGPKIITAVVQVIINHVLLGMSLFAATAHPRVHDQLIYHGAAVTTVEKSTLETGETITLKDRTIMALKSRNHDVLDIDYMGTVQSISVDLETRSLSASCDIRKGGEPDGY